MAANRTIEPLVAELGHSNHSARNMRGRGFHQSRTFADASRSIGVSVCNIEVNEVPDIAGERLRLAIEGNAFEVGTHPSIDITISIGVSELGRDGDTLDDFLRSADKRLYRAKHEGRNCVIAE